VPKPGLPKKYAKMGFKKGWKAFKAAKRKRIKRAVAPRPKRTSAGKVRRGIPRGRSVRRRKTFNIPLVKTVAGLALFSIAKGSQTSKGVLADPLAALQTSGNNLIAGKDKAITIAVASLAAQFLSSDILRKKEIASLGALKIKV